MTLDDIEQPLRQISYNSEMQSEEAPTLNAFADDVIHPPSEVLK